MVATGRHLPCGQPRLRLKGRWLTESLVAIRNEANDSVEASLVFQSCFAQAEDLHFESTRDTVRRER